VLSDLPGTYTNCVDYQGGGYGPYTVNITGTSTGPTSAALVIKNLAAGAFGPFGPSDNALNPGIKVNIDWSNPANFTAVVTTQPFYVDPTYGQAKMVTDVGTFSSCANTFTLNYSVAVAAGSFGAFTTTIAR
jgi:hypothetical protein